MTKEETIAAFTKFLKSKRLYSKYLRLFAIETMRPIKERYNRRPENTITDFFNNHPCDYWILHAFTWEHDNNKLWNAVYDNWDNYLETLKDNDKERSS